MMVCWWLPTFFLMTVRVATADSGPLSRCNLQNLLRSLPDKIKMGNITVTLNSPSLYGEVHIDSKLVKSNIVGVKKLSVHNIRGNTKQSSFELSGPLDVQGSSVDGWSKKITPWSSHTDNSHLLVKLVPNGMFIFEVKVKINSSKGLEECKNGLPDPFKGVLQQQFKTLLINEMQVTIASILKHILPV